MWTKHAEERTKDLGLSIKQIEELSSRCGVGYNMLTMALKEAKEMGIIAIQPITPNNPKQS